MQPLWILISFLTLVSGQKQSQKMDRCMSPPDSGSFKGRGEPLIRYYYSALNSQCAMFPFYGGGGNANNFRTEEECLAICSKANDLTLDAIRSARRAGKCWYNGRRYSPRDSIPEISKDHGCAQACFCQQSEDLRSPPSITCAQFSCGFLPIPEKCVGIYNNTRDCCHDGFKCPGPSTFKCTYKGQTYLEGERFYPEEYPCFECTCNRKYRGILNLKEVCKEVNCGLNIFYQDQRANNCKPEYYQSPRTGQKLCCPINWNC